MLTDDCYTILILLNQIDLRTLYQLNVTHHHLSMINEECKLFSQFWN